MGKYSVADHADVASSKGNNARSLMRQLWQQCTLPGAYLDDFSLTAFAVGPTWRTSESVRPSIACSAGSPSRLLHRAGDSLHQERAGAGLAAKTSAAICNALFTAAPPA